MSFSTLIEFYFIQSFAYSILFIYSHAIYTSYTYTHTVHVLCIEQSKELKIIEQLWNYIPHTYICIIRINVYRVKTVDICVYWYAQYTIYTYKIYIYIVHSLCTIVIRVCGIKTESLNAKSANVMIFTAVYWVIIANINREKNTQNSGNNNNINSSRCVWFCFVYAST